MGAKKGNQNAIGNNGGRPAKFSTPEELQKKVDEYFNGGANKRTYVTAGGNVEVEVLTICGLAYYLGFVSRQSLLDYENKIEFTDIIKTARLRIEMNYEELLQDRTPTGSIFALKNMGWKDRSELTGADGKDLMPKEEIDYSKLSDSALREIANAKKT